MLGAELTRIADELSGGGRNGDARVASDNEEITSDATGRGTTSPPHGQQGSDGSDAATSSNTLRKALQIRKHRNSQRGNTSSQCGNGSVPAHAGKTAGGRTGDTIVSFGGRIGEMPRLYEYASIHVFLCSGMY